LFDFFLFGFYATYIARTFFPAESEFAALMLTFAVCPLTRGSAPAHR
jgi:MHS family citrate/tricarballylate:H+ symporter-like MFS transporter